MRTKIKVFLRFLFVVAVVIALVFTGASPIQREEAWDFVSAIAQWFWNSLFPPEQELPHAMFLSQQILLALFCGFRFF